MVTLFSLTAVTLPLTDAWMATLSLPSAAAAIGYKELLPYLSGEKDLALCTESLKRATRRYAKRQLTWFKRDSAVHWFNIDVLSFEEIEAEALRLIRQELAKAE